MRPVSITIDLRMLHSSGIGTYLRNLVPLVIAANPDKMFTLLGEAKELNSHNWAHSKNILIIDCQVPMFSITAQYILPRQIPKETTLFWSPHFDVPLFYSGKLLVTVYDAFHLAMPEFVGGVHKRLYAKIMLNAVRIKADAILTISNFTKRELNRLTGCKNEKIFPIHLGVAESWFCKDETVNPHGRPYLLYVGNVKPHKNLGNLIDAYSLLFDKIPHDLVIIGKKEGFITGDNAVISKAAKLGGRVHFTGYVNETLLKQYVSHAAIFIFPSLYEGFGLPPLEAMATGCPVIVSNAASLPEVCGDAALYCDPHDINDIAEKIKLVMNDGNLRERMRVKGFEHAKLFTWEKCASETLSVIEKVICQ